MRASPEIAVAIGLAVRPWKVEVTAALALLSNLRPVFARKLTKG